MLKSTAAVALLLLLTSCGAMRYDLDGLDFPVSASPNAYGTGEPFELESKYVMYVHGLFEDKQPKVKELLEEHCGDVKAVTDFRVSAGASIYDWLGTHLSLGFIRLKTVRITGKITRK